MRLGIVGAGRRVERFYADVLPVLACRGLLELAGLTSRTQARAEEMAARLGVPAFPSLDELVKGGRCDALLLAVPADPREALAQRALALDQHLFLESPAARHPRTVRAMLARAAASKRLVEIAEEQSCSPEAEVQRAAVSSGALGRVLAVTNHGLEFYYHGAARLSRLVPRSAAVSYSGRNLAMADGAVLQLREARFADGLLYVSRYVDPKTHPARGSADWEIACERGVLRHSDVAWSDADGARLSVAGQELRWTDPYGQPRWTRQHHGLAHLIAGFARAVRDGTPLAYGLERAVADVELWRALELAPRIPIARAPAALVHCVLGMRR